MTSCPASWLLLIGVCWLAAGSPALAGSRLQGTGGVMPIEGGSGGGLSPWGVLTGTASDGEVSVTAGGTRADVDDYHLVVHGVAANLYDRLELSLASQRLALDTLGGQQRQEIYGVKMRLFGDVLYRPWGVWSLGVQHKQLVEGRALARAVGAQKMQGNDVYLAGSKLFFNAIAGRNLLVNTTLRSTKANQGGLLGFGGDEGHHREWMVEGSVGLFLTPDWLVGVEYRQKPDNLGFAREDDWRDLYLAWLINKNVSLTGALVDLGSVAGLERQRGGYLSLQLAL
ncbi:DUF3034 family protein [Kushneria sp. AK178]